MDRGAWQATVYAVQRVGHDLVTEHTHAQLILKEMLIWCTFEFLIILKKFYQWAGFILILSPVDVLKT